MTAISRALIWIALALLGSAFIVAQDVQGDKGPASSDDSAGAATGSVVGHPFSAIKYAERVKLMPDGKTRFIRNERYPTQIARDAQGRVMLQVIDRDDLLPECDQLQIEKPPPCPSWVVFVVDPIARVLTHWVDGVMGGRVAVDMPLTAGDMERMLPTAEMPELRAEFDPAEGEPKTLDLGVKILDGVRAHGVRTTLESRETHRVLRIHEVWTAPELKLIVRVIDGDPNGIETIWGVNKISTQPDPALFRPPDGYEVQHRRSGEWDTHDLDYLESWFEK